MPKLYNFEISVGPGSQDFKVSVEGKELRGVQKVELKKSDNGGPVLKIWFEAGGVKIVGKGQVEEYEGYAAGNRHRIVS